MCVVFSGVLVLGFCVFWELVLVVGVGAYDFRDIN